MTKRIKPKTKLQPSAPVPMRAPEQREHEWRTLAQLAAQVGERIGSTGLKAFGGFVREAYISKLYWPQAYKVYNDMWRRSPNISATANIMGWLADSVTWKFEPPSDAPGDQRAAEFGNTVLEDMEGEFRQSVRDALTAPFYGWSLQETVFGKRTQGWVGPDGDRWYTRYNDGMIGWRSIEMRGQGSFLRWDMDDSTKQLRGMVQLDPPNATITIPIEKAIHFTPNRDGGNPEGRSVLEPAYQPYYIAQGLWVVLGNGFERSVLGFPVFEAQEGAGTLSGSDNAAVAAAVRQVLASLENSYLLVPPGLKFHLESVSNTNSDGILSAIQYCDALMLRTVLADFMSLGIGGDSGSWALGSDKSAMFIMALNGILNSYADAVNAGAARRLFEINASRLPGMTYFPKLTHGVVHKPAPLSELADFVTRIAQYIPLDGDDVINIRERSDGILATRTAQDLQPAPTTPTAQPAPVAAPEQAQVQAAQFTDGTRWFMSDGKELRFPSFGDGLKDGDSLKFRMPVKYEDWKLATPDAVELSIRSATRDYKGALSAWVAETFNGRMSAVDLARAMRALLKSDAPLVYVEGMRAGGMRDASEDDLEDPDTEQISAWVKEQSGFVRSFAKDVEAAQDADARKKVLARVDTWAQAFATLGAFGRAAVDSDQMVTWKLGQTVEHCATCSALNGKRRRMSWFTKNGYIPRQPMSETLECKGVHCDCEGVNDAGERVL